MPKFKQPLRQHLINRITMKISFPLLLVVMLFTACQKDIVYQLPASGASTTGILAGNGVQGNFNGTGTGASFYQPTGVAVDASGNVYVADLRNNMIREISPAGVVTTMAGSGLQGSANGIGGAASFYQPTGVAVDASGNVYVAENGNDLIREISQNGTVTTFAGTGASGAVNATGTAASFNHPQGIAVDANGNIYVADYDNNLIREISPAGVTTTLAGNSNPGADDGNGTAASFNEPTAVAIDASFNVYVADFGNNLIRKISPAGSVTTLAGSGAQGSADGTGKAASFKTPTGVAVDAAGNVYVADWGNNLVRIISPAGAVSTLTSTASSKTPLVFNGPYGIAVDATGNIYVAAYGNSEILKISK
jgi:sugar lactone lactonase YvrE